MSVSIVSSSRFFAGKPGELRGMQRKRSAFTLIELLVVIAIIAILAAILFPVFAQARGKARQAACLSNEKQITLAMLQYMQDYDSVIPPYRTRVPFVFNGLFYGNYAAGSPFTGTYWSANLQPYIKSYAVLFCPDGFDTNLMASDSNDGIRQIGPHYGLNVDYLYQTYDGTNCFDVKLGADDGDGWARPAADSDFKAPGNTVMLADNKVTIQSTGGGGASYYGTSIGGWVVSPGNYLADDCCSPYGNLGWGQDDVMQTAAFGGNLNRTSTGNFSPRHNAGGNLAFMDGHVKFYVPGAAAVGTDWKVGSSYTSVNITNKATYLWSRNK